MNEVVNLLAQVDAGASPQALLDQALPVIQAALRDVQSVTVYRRAHAGVTLWASTDPDADAQAFIPAAEMPGYQEALIADEMFGGVAPLHAQGDVIALLVAEPAHDDTTLSTEYLQAICRQLEILLENRLLQQWFQRQTTTAAALTTCEDFEDVVRVIAQNTIDTGQYATLNLFELDESGTPVRARAMTSANREQTFAQDDIIDVGTDYVQRVYSILDAEGEALISDIESDGRLSEQGRTWLRERRIKSLYMLPLRVGGDLQGFISIIDSKQPLAFNTIERRTYQALAQQAANVVEQRRMLETTTADLQQQQSLYNLTAALMNAHDVPDIMQVLHTHLGDDVRNISYSENTYSDDDTFESFTIRYILDDAGLSEVNMPLSQLLDEKQFDDVKTYWEQVGTNLEIVEDYDNLDKNAAFLHALRAQGVGSSISIPIVEDGRRERQINITWEEPRAFDEQTRRLLETAQSQITLVLRNRHLLAQTRESARQSSEQAKVLRMLNELINTTEIEQSETMLLNATAKLLHDATGVDHVGIALIDQEKDTSHVVSEYPDKGSIGMEVEAGAGSIAEKLRQERQVIMVGDIDDSEKLQPQSRAALETSGAASSFFVPMFDLDGTLLGSIGLDSATSRENFDDHAIDIARTVGTQVAINLQKLRLLRSSQRQAAQMQEITAFSQSIQATLHVEDILRTALDASMKVFPADYLGIFPYERENKTLRQAAVRYEDAQTVALPGAAVTDDANTVAQHAWREQEMVRVQDLRAGWDWKHPHDDTLRTLLALPLVASGMRLGVLEMGNRSADAYSTTDIAAFQQMGNQIAVALSNANAYAQSQKLAQNKARANEIVAELQEQTDVEAILQVTARELGRALGAKRARIRLSATSVDSSNGASS